MPQAKKPSSPRAPTPRAEAMRRAIVLGLLQGPTEMAPISSSAHTALLRRRWRGQHGHWDGCGRGSAFRKSFEVALHGGTVCALLLSMGGPLRRVLQRSCSQAGEQAMRRRLGTLALSLLPPALAGALLERPIERRLDGRSPIAIGLLVGAIAMALADRREGRRTVEQADLGDGLALGLAQAVALAPGVSRRGATLATARLRGFTRRDADALSWLVALPVIAGACALKSVRLAYGRPLPAQQRQELSAGICASFLSTLASARLLQGPLSRSPLAPFCLYRIALALLILT